MPATPGVRAFPLAFASGLASYVLVGLLAGAVALVGSGWSNWYPWAILLAAGSGAAVAWVEGEQDGKAYAGAVGLSLTGLLLAMVLFLYLPALV